MAKDELEVFYSPIGGAGQIGMNLYLYGYKLPNKETNWIMVDCGIGFTDDYYPGVDIMVPDISFLNNNKNKLLAIILTHSHEDHYGAVSSIINDKIDVPIYCTRFTSELLKEKISEDYTENYLDIKILKDNATFNIGKFKCNLINVAHSIPEPNAINIAISDMNIIHTADWKIDDKPVINRKTDLEKLKKIGQKRCDILVCDSTNILRKETSITESKVALNLKKAIKDIKGMAIVTTFSSNVSRLISIINAAHSNKRQVVLSGRSIKRFVKVAKFCGYIDKDIFFVDEKDISKKSRKDVLLICTGSQGEPNAALSKIANGRNNIIQLAKDDTVIFSSKTIPGNESSIGFLKNKIIEYGAGIIDDSMQDIHTTGHPSRPEVEKLYNLLKPNTLIPMHGELFHLAEHIKVAKENNIKNPIFAKNGDLIRLYPGSPTLWDQSEPNFFLRDGDVFITPTDRALKDRRRLQDSGIVFVNLVLDKNLILYVDPIVEMFGIPNKMDDIDNVLEFIEDKIDDALDSLPKAKKSDDDYMIGYIEKAIRNHLFTLWGKKPLIRVCLTFV